MSPQENIQTRTLTPVTVPSAPQRTSQGAQVHSSEVKDGSPQQNYEGKKAVFRSYQIVWYVLSAIEVLLGFRVLLKLVSANSQNGFANFIYAVSDPLALPFAGIVASGQAAANQVEWSTLVAMLFYAAFAYGIVGLLSIAKPTDQEEVERTVDNQ